MCVMGTTLVKVDRYYKNNIISSFLDTFSGYTQRIRKIYLEEDIDEFGKELYSEGKIIVYHMSGFVDYVKIE